MRVRMCLLLLGVGYSLAAPRANADVILTVGPGGQFTTISAAAAFADANANNRYDIQVAPGTYQNDFPTVTTPLTIELNPNDTGQVLLLATVPLPNEKGIILTTSSLTVKGLTFEGAEISNALGGNGAAIRDLNGDKTAATLGHGPPGHPNPPVNLTVINSTFLNNQAGILTGFDTSETIQVVNSKFENNGNPSDPSLDVFDHALYVNYAGSLTVTDSLFCGQLIGHDIKSRALITTIKNNQIFDGAAGPGICRAGTTSYGIDVPNGGVATISGNHIVQGPGTQNTTMVIFGEEGNLFSDNSLLVSDNSFVNSGVRGSIGVFNFGKVDAQLKGNTFDGVNCELEQKGVCGTQPVGTPVPEPSSLWLLLSALGGMCIAGRLSLPTTRGVLGI